MATATTKKTTTKTTKAADAETTVKTDGATVTVKQPTGKKKKTTVEVATRPVGGFIEFLRERAVVGLAVAFVLGTQIQTVVKQLISSFIDPMFQLLFSGNKALSNRTFTLHFESRYANFGWGALMYTLIDFLFVAFAVYAVIKLFQLDKLDKKPAK
jgi:large conductance mechanosensitive channel protein